MVGGLLGVARLENICSPENGIAHWPSFAETSVGSIVDNATEDPNQSRCALGGIRTRTGAGLSRLPLPLGYEGLAGGCHQATISESSWESSPTQQIQGDPVKDVGLADDELGAAEPADQFVDDEGPCADAVSYTHLTLPTSALV